MSWVERERFNKANEIDRRRLAAAFWEIYNGNKDEVYRQALCKHLYGILSILSLPMLWPTLMQRSDVEFSVNQEGKVFFKKYSRSKEANSVKSVQVEVEVETNVQFVQNLESRRQELQTKQKNLEGQEERLNAELNRCNSVKEKTLPEVQDYPDDSDVKQSVLGLFDNLEKRLQSLQRRLQLQQKSLEYLKRKVEITELVKEIGDSLLEQIKQGNST